MRYYNKFYVDGCEDSLISRDFLRAVLACSDAFSLVYFRYRENEKLSNSARQIKKDLSSFQLHSQYVSEWPGTKTQNDRNHLYRMVTYRADIDILPVIERVSTIWDWDYPQYPMDPSFYRNGYAWFVVTSHERMNTLYLEESNSVPSVMDLESLGLSLIPEGKTEEAKLS